MRINNLVEFRSEKQKRYREYMSPSSLSQDGTRVESINYSQDIKRPLKINHSDLSFKGLSFGLYNKLDAVYDKKEFLEFAEKYLGQMGKELFNNVVETNSSRTSKLISLNDEGKIVIHKKSIPHLAIDGLLYPFKILPADMLNGAVEFLGKIPGLKSWSERTLAKDFFKNIRQRSKIDAKVNSLTGLITYRDSKLEAKAKELNKTVAELTPEEIKSVDDAMESYVFQNGLKQFDLKSGNYDTKHERALNRLVSGLPPAVFLATDAYNLSRMMDDDQKAANKERKTRFKQETSRILTSGYLTLITMGAFQKFINNSKAGIVLLTGTTVLVTEMFSRLANGKFITRLTPEQARKINAKKNGVKESDSNDQSKKTEQTQTNMQGRPKVDNKTKEKPLLSFDTLMKASAVILALGYGLKGLKKHIPAVDDAFKSAFRPFKNLYNKLTLEEFKVSKNELTQVVDILKQGGFDKLAEKYEKVGLSAIDKENSNIIDLGMKDKKVKPLVNFVIAPFKFMWNTVTLPYWMVDEKILPVVKLAINKFTKQAPKEATQKSLTEAAKELEKADIKALANSFAKLSKEAQKKNIDMKKFQDYIQDNFLKGFNADSRSNVSNAELSNLAKTAAYIATLWFLMTDNYNMVMLKSNGNDKEGAETKFKERFVQEGSRLFYQTLLIDLFNSTFRNQYNASLWGMSWITFIDTTLGEMLTRSSVGTAIKPHTRDELIDIETKQNNSTGFKKKYYRFMQRLTGKRSIKSYEVASNNENEKTVNIPTIDSNNKKTSGETNLLKLVKNA